MSRAAPRFLGCALLASLALLAGCARTGAPHQLTARNPVAFYDARDSSTTRQVREFTAADGARLGYFHDQPPASDARTAIVYLHGIESHAGWFEGPARMLAARGYDVFSLDRRGSGINRENRGFASGDAPSFDLLLRDVHAFIRTLDGRYDRRVLIGLSWGGKLAIAYALAHPDDVDSLALITPGLAARVDLGPFEKLRLVLALLVRPTARFEIPLEPELFTRDAVWQDRIRRDPLRLHHATARFLYQSRRLDGWIARRIEANRAPILLVLAGHDRIIDNDAVVALLGRGSQPVMQVLRYADQTHSIQFEAPGRLAGAIDAWIRAAGSDAVSRQHPRQTMIPGETPCR